MSSEVPTSWPQRHQNTWAPHGPLGSWPRRNHHTGAFLTTEHDAPSSALWPSAITTAFWLFCRAHAIASRIGFRKQKPWPSSHPWAPPSLPRILFLIADNCSWCSLNAYHMLGTVWSICWVWNHFRSLSHSGMEVFILSLPYSKDRAGIKPLQAGSRACPLNPHNLLPSLVGARRCLRGWICVKYKENNLAGLTVGL